MTLFKIEDAIAESRPGLSHSDILRMPFYEFMLKLTIMEEKAEEREKKENSSTKDYSFDKQRSQMSKQMSTPKMPKMPSGFKL